jgi:thioesterase domain-containing protein
MIHLLQSILLTELPLTQHIGVRVSSVDPDKVILAAPLAGNHNHAGSAFAGSINALATLAGWSWVWAMLQREELATQVVIQDSSIVYDRPVTSDFQAICVAPRPLAISRFLTVVRRRGLGRISLQVEVSDLTGRAVAFRGRYVAQRLPNLSTV